MPAITPCTTMHCALACAAESQIARDLDQALQRM